jgi:glycosyltransferase involved in cell wall biosynthesis
VNILVVAQQLSGFDGVSICATQHGVALRNHLGHHVTFMAGHFGPGISGFNRRVHFGATWADTPGGVPPDVDWHVLRSEIGRSDAVIVHNLFALPSASAAALAVRDVLAETGKPFIVVHHDFSHEVADRATHDMFPVTPERGVHLCINRAGQSFLSPRAAHVYLEPPSGPLFAMSPDERRTRRQATRARLRLAESEILVLMPVTPYPRKNVGSAICLIASARRARIPARLWCTGATPASLMSLGLLEQAQAISMIAGRAEHTLDAFAAADRMLMSSDHEGWGMPITEAAHYRVPIITSEMGVVADHESMGLTRRPMSIGSIVALPSDRELAANSRYARWFSTHRLAQRMEGWLLLAEQLSGRSSGWHARHAASSQHDVRFS